MFKDSLLGHRLGEWPLKSKCWTGVGVLSVTRTGPAYSASHTGRKGYSQFPLCEYQILRISSVILIGWKYFTQRRNNGRIVQVQDMKAYEGGEV